MIEVRAKVDNGKAGAAFRWRRSLKKLPFGLLFLLALTCQSSGAEPIPEEPFWLEHFFEKGAISPIAEAIRKKKVWGFIDTNGKFVIQPKYDKVEYFSKGVTLVTVGKTAYIIDKTGKVLETHSSAMEVLNQRSKDQFKARNLESVEIQNKLFKGDIYNADGTVFLAKSKDVQLSLFSQDLAACKLPESVIKRFGSQFKARTEFGEQNDINEKLLNTWGYINKEGRMVIPPRFYRASDFTNGIASVFHWFLKEDPQDPELGGYIDKSGNIIGRKYTHAFCSDWSEGFGDIAEKVKGKSRNNNGFIDASGKRILGPWMRTHPFSAGYAAVQDRKGLWGFIDKSGKMVVSPRYRDVDYEIKEDRRWVKTDTGYGFIDSNLKMAIPSRFSDIESFYEGLSAAAINIPDSEKLRFIAKESDYVFGFVDLQGKEIIEAKFNGARQFSQGLAPVLDGLCWGYVNKDGKMAIKPQFEDAYPFHEGLAAVQINERWGFIDLAGKFVIAPKYKAVPWYENPRPHNFSEGLSLFAEPDEQFAYINKQGEKAFDPPSAICTVSDVSNADFSEGLAVWENKFIGLKFGYIDRSGKYVIPPKLSEAKPFSEGLAAVRIVFDKPNQTKVKSIHVHKDPAWRHDLPESIPGYIDHKGNFFSRPKYDELGPFKEGLARASICTSNPRGKGSPLLVQMTLNGPSWNEGEFKCGFINKNGLEVIKLKFDEAGDFSEGLAAIRLGNKFGFIDKTGKIVIPPKFDLVGPFKSGAAVADLNGLFGHINKKGKFIKQPSYLLSDSFNEERALVVKSTRKSPGKRIRTNFETIMFLDDHGFHRGTNWSGNEK